jgi:hypothetical protein
VVWEYRAGRGAVPEGNSAVVRVEFGAAYRVALAVWSCEILLFVYRTSHLIALCQHCRFCSTFGTCEPVVL